MRMHAACAHAMFCARVAQLQAKEAASKAAATVRPPARAARAAHVWIAQPTLRVSCLFVWKTVLSRLSHTRGAGDWDAGVQAAF